jgi:hypothetical protein
LDVTFTPSEPGQRSASITITDDAAVSSQVLPLKGVGGDLGPDATLSPSSLVFGSQDPDTTSAAQPITLSNYGTTTLSITSIAASTDFGETNTSSLVCHNSSAVGCISEVKRAA